MTNHEALAERERIQKAAAARCCYQRQHGERLVASDNVALTHFDPFCDTCCAEYLAIGREALAAQEVLAEGAPEWLRQALWLSTTAAEGVR